jgi:phosphate:Na+ symporter
MNVLESVVAILATVALFVFSLKGFSGELQAWGTSRLKLWLSKVTKTRMGGILFGITMTALVQSSSAVTSITTALVDAGVISFSQSLSVLVGSNLGTTFTAWIVAFNFTGIGAFLLILGTLIGWLPFRIHLAGKSIFYLGLILFSLTLISNSLTPIKDSPFMLQVLVYSEIWWAGILVGMVLTALIQSSSAVTGLAIVLAAQQILPFSAALYLIVGCNVGTTSTAILASFRLNNVAKRTALANLAFNVLGVLVFLPFLPFLNAKIQELSISVGAQVALAHLLFNLLVAVVAFPFIPWVAKRWTPPEASLDQ